MVAREPLGPASSTCIYMEFYSYFAVSSASSVRNIHSSLHPHTIAFICINHSAVVYAHILNNGDRDPDNLIHYALTFLPALESGYNAHYKSEIWGQGILAPYFSNAT
jgi:hypothetical protein